MILSDVIAGYVPPGAVAMGRQVQRSKLALAWRWPALTKVTGRSATSGREAAVVVAGDSPINWSVLQCLFEGEPETISLGRCWLGALPKRLRSLEDGADLLIARVETGVSAGLFGETFLRLPESIDARIAVPHPDERWPRTQSARSNAARARKHGLAWSDSRDPGDFDLFYDDMYVPFVRARFGDRGTTASRTMLRRCFARGGLQWIMQGPNRVAGQLLEPEGRRLRCVVMGVDPDKDGRGLGVGAATVLFAVEYARSHGFDIVDRGGTQPSLRNPILKSKHSWGADFAVRRRATHDLLVAWPRWNDLAAEFLTSYAPIHRQGTTLAGFTAPFPEEDAAQLAVRGLQALFVVDGTCRSGTRLGDAPTGAPLVGLEPGSSEQLVSGAARFLSGRATERRD